MGKFRKMLAGVLSAAMVLSTMTVTAFAAETKMPTIDTTKKGSITINKYEGDDTTKPLEGVTFTIYKIADLEQGSNPVELKYKSLITGVNITSETKYNDIKSVVDSKIADGSLTGTSATTVMESGKATAKFTELDLGIYLVEETKAPSQVVNKTANFLVSVPMTNEDGDDWVYDIIANPKNETVYGGITLIKKGKTIKVNGSETEETLKNVSFELQKKETTGWTKVDEYKTNGSGVINVTGLAPATYRFIETNLGGTDDNKGYILDGKTAYEFTVQTDGKIQVGTTEASESATITVYNEKPSLEKSVENANGSYDNDTDASVGDTVTWKVEASVPSNVNELKTYKLTDKMSDALTWENKAKANLEITTNNSTTLEASTDYTLTVPEDNTTGGTWTIEFTEAGKTKLATSNVKVITVTFNTKLNENAIIGSEGNLNDAELDYSNAIYPTEDPDNPNKGNTPGEDKIKDQAIVYSFRMNIEKVDGKDSTIKLQGVTFDLYSYTGAKTNPTEADLKGSDGTLVEQNLTTDADGKIQKSGLKNGTYYLVETKTVKTKDGKQYNLLKEPVKVEIKVDYVTKTETTITKDVNGNVADTTTVSTKTFTGGDTGSDGTFTVTVKNYTGFDLPITGGMGTVLFSIAGFALMAGAAFVLLKGRRKDA
ncbi:SpaH/EbpB family LPXTG-anchored major pilin [[Ruminococcus] torques]|uniref:Fimbrial subunit type 1 n=1 Tax=[Ruminococcus] torques TaxID=33039 RepID=A0A174ZJY6_9FIRM|nr:SpaH/EbpB family LPXTG-anchored major pilin [[Ruminococcus] torques]CUQ87665.1 Fimbrial subunit type 1 precursor [[Ruminococcus] torques]